MTKIQKQDWKFVGVDPDSNFVPERNKRIIEETILKSKILQSRKKREYMDKVQERTDAVAQYLTSLNTGKTSSGVETYFGRREMARLRGEEILDIIRAKIGHGIKEKLKQRIPKT